MNTKTISPGAVNVAAPPPISNARLAAILFICTELMLFVGMIAAYVVLRYGSNNFDNMISPPMGLTAFSTPILILSSLSLIVAQRAFQRSANQWVRLGALGALTFGAMFLGIQYAEWRSLMSSGIIPADNVNSGMFYLLSGAHGLHVIGGLILLAVLSLRASRKGSASSVSGTLAVASIYWHFVTLMWVSLFVMLFML